MFIEFSDKEAIGVLERVESECVRVEIRLEWIDFWERVKVGSVDSIFKKGREC